MDKKFWKNKKVFITGHTGFKGSWLCLWLTLLGAKVTGYALHPPTTPSLFKLCNIGKLIDKSVIADIRNLKKLKQALSTAKPEIVIHMAAQPLVRDSYKYPIETYTTNVIGTANLLEAVRSCKSVKAVVNVTTDKVYENQEYQKPFKENEPLGGYDPYSSSKACSELVTAAYRCSFLSPEIAVATARAGNVIGGGDWASDRIIPDFIRAVLNGKKLKVRNPAAVRPWQHVLEPLCGYLLLAQKLYEEGTKYSEAWNFGPDHTDEKSVEWIVKKLCAKWGVNASYAVDKGSHPHESHYLTLDSSKARDLLGWQPKWALDYALDKIVEWTKAYAIGGNLREICRLQIEEYMGA
jgi:CDP-glucose 4,6-dehydratase